MLEDLQHASAKVELEMNVSKTKIMSPTGQHLEIQDQTVENVNQYIYLGHTVKLGKEIQTAEVARRVALTWSAFGKLQYILKDINMPISFKRRVHEACILPVSTY